MKIFRVRSLVVAVPVLLALALPADEVGFHPKSGSDLAKKLKVEIELKVEKIEINMNGESQAPEGMDDQTMLVNLLVGVTDKYVDTKDGHPTELLRTYDELELTGEFGDEKKPAEGFDKLQNHTVRFKWNDESKSYDRSYHESKGDEADLEHLLEDMDLRVLLPEKKVAEGDTWDVPGEKLAPLFLPGGMPGKAGGKSDNEKFEAIGEQIKAELEKSLKDFKVTCKYKGTHQDGDLRVGAVEIVFDGKADVDLSQILQRVAEESEGEAGMKPEIDAKAVLSLKGEGELLWDVAGGHVHAFTMQSDVGLDADAKISIDMEGQSFEFSASGRVGGKATWSLTTSKP